MKLTKKELVYIRQVDAASCDCRDYTPSNDWGSPCKCGHVYGTHWGYSYRNPCHATLHRDTEP